MQIAKVRAANPVPTLKAETSPQALRAEPAAVAVQELNARPAPKPLAADQYKQLTGKTPPKPHKGMDLKAPKTPVLEHLVLSPQNAFSGFGWLEFIEVRHVDIRNNFVMFYGNQDPAMALSRATFKVEKDAKYLIDISVSVGSKTTFHVGSGSESIEVTLDPGSHHILAYLTSDEKGTTSVGIFPKNFANYTFYGVEITKL